MSLRALRLATAVLALAGIAIAGYLTWVHYAELEPFCVGGGGGCERVQALATGPSWPACRWRSWASAATS